VGSCAGQDRQRGTDGRVADSGSWQSGTKIIQGVNCKKAFLSGRKYRMV
jgi:hypothetical protein